MTLTFTKFYVVSPPPIELVGEFKRAPGIPLLALYFGIPPPVRGEPFKGLNREEGGFYREGLIGRILHRILVNFEVRLEHLWPTRRFLVDTSEFLRVELVRLTSRELCSSSGADFSKMALMQKMEALMLLPEPNPSP